MFIWRIHHSVHHLSVVTKKYTLQQGMFEEDIIPSLVCVCIWTVLSFGDVGDSHSGRDRHRLDHPKQNHHHTWSGHRWVSLGSATDHTGELRAHQSLNVSDPCSASCCVALLWL